MRMLKVRDRSLRSLSKGALGRTLGSFGVKRIFDLRKNSEIYDPMTLGASTNYGCSLWHLGFPHLSRRCCILLVLWCCCQNACAQPIYCQDGILLLSQGTAIKFTYIILSYMHRLKARKSYVKARKKIWTVNLAFSLQLALALSLLISV